jgi:hypothetical protein
MPKSRMNTMFFGISAFCRWVIECLDWCLNGAHIQRKHIKSCKKKPTNMLSQTPFHRCVRFCCAVERHLRGERV